MPAATATIAEVVDGIIARCEEIALPNSMARPPGFDINAHLRVLERQRADLVARVRSADAVSFVRKRLEKEADGLSVHCLRQLLSEIHTSPPAVAR